MDETKKIVFFDGYCSLCNGVVDFVISNKKENHTVYFSSLQSDYAIDFLAKHQKDANALKTFFFYEGNTIYEKSTAALRVSKYLKKPYSFSIDSHSSMDKRSFLSVHSQKQISPIWKDRQLSNAY